MPELAAISAARLFPPDVGVHRCAIPAGGPFQRTPLRGKCGVRLTSVWSVPKVSFAESWPRRDGKGGFRHVWTVAIAHGRPVLVGERGSIPPQAWR